MTVTVLVYIQTQPLVLEITIEMDSEKLDALMKSSVEDLEYLHHSVLSALSPTNRFISLHTVSRWLQMKGMPTSNELKELDVLLSSVLPMLKLGKLSDRGRLLEDYLMDILAIFASKSWRRINGAASPVHTDN